MELRQLQYFAEVVNVGSFLGAANRLDTPQPSLWRQVKSLEKELGVPLFERSGRRVKASSAGLLLLPLAEQVLVGASKVKELAAEITHGRAGVVTVACAYPHLLRFLAPLIGSFHAKHPDIHIAIQGWAGLPPMDEVLTGDADFVTSLPASDPRLNSHLLGEARIVVVTTDEHPWRHRRSVEVAELAGEPLLIGNEMALSRRLIEPALRATGTVLDVVYESHDVASLVALARAGLGVAVVADDHLMDEPTGPDWPVLEDGGTEMATQVWINWSAGRPLSPPVARFADHVRSSAG